MPITIVTIVGRTLLALLFILAGAAKIAGPQPFLDHMAAHHIPGVLLPLVIALELGAGLALLLGWQLSFAAGALALSVWPPRSGFTSILPTRRNGRCSSRIWRLREH
jgi:putative oxidoreductase